jgi:flagellar assembly factor FliW
MPEIKINGQELFYDEDRIVEFSEGLIGLPEFRRAVFIDSAEFAPFGWLASLDDENVHFVVVDPGEIYADYAVEEKPVGNYSLATIVKVSSDWQSTTVNLRAPIFVDRNTKRGTQIILADTKYSLEEALPLS